MALVAAAVAGVLVVGVLVHLAASLMVHHRGALTAADRLKATNDARTSIIQLLGGAALLGGLAYTARTFALTRAGQQAERFTKAIERLTDAKESARTGAVYSLDQLARESPSYRPLMREVLTAHLREQASQDSPQVPTDVQAVIRVLLVPQRSRADGDARGPDLRNLHLKGVDLSGADLRLLRLEAADLAGADLTDAHLEQAVLTGATLDGAILHNASFTNASLNGASARRADFYQASLDGCDMDGCDLLDAENIDQKRLAPSKGTPMNPPAT